MTNSEATEQLKERYDIGQKEYLNLVPEYIESLKLAMESLEENTKLKAEIERLKIEPDKEALDDAFDLGYQTCLRHNGVCWKDAEEIQKLRKEIERLKSELEQSVKLQIVLSKLLFGTEFARCYMCDNSMKNITLDGKNNGCDGSCYHEKNYTENDFIEKIKCEFDRIERRKQ